MEKPGCVVPVALDVKKGKVSDGSAETYVDIYIYIDNIGVPRAMSAKAFVRS